MIRNPVKEIAMKPSRANRPRAYVLLALLATLCLSPVFTAPGVQAASTERHVLVTGSGTVSLQPDTATIQLGVTARGGDVLQVQSQTNARVAAILAKLREIGLPEGDVAATDLRISPRYRYDKIRQESVADGFEVARDLQITLRDLSLLANVMSQVVELGANSVSPPRLSSSHFEASYQAALKLAVAQARARAETIASASATRLGDVISINVQGANPRPEPMALRAMAADSAESSYQLGDLTARASVNVKFSLQP